MIGTFLHVNVRLQSRDGFRGSADMLDKPGMAPRRSFADGLAIEFEAFDRSVMGPVY